MNDRLLTETQVGSVALNDSGEAGRHAEPAEAPQREKRAALAQQQRNVERAFAAHEPAEGARASLAMAMAANIGPDIFETDIRQAVAEGLAYPLTEWIGQDGVLADGRPKLRPDGSPDRNGQIDADEAKRRCEATDRLRR